MVLAVGVVGRAEASEPLTVDFLARYFGDCILDEVGWYERTFGGLTPRQKDSYVEMGAWLLQDVGGIVREWERLEPFAGGVTIEREAFGVDCSPGQVDSHWRHLLALGVGSVRLTVGYGGVEGVETVLQAAEIEPLVKLVQPREEYADLERWRAVLRDAFGGLSPRVKYFEIGTCPNRIKWSGYETLYDYAEAARVAREVAKEFPEVRLVGPATQDFEPYWTAAVLRPFDGFDVLSDHLYVDRSGEPESAEEGIFDLVGKARMFKAIGRLHGIEQFWSTQFNWERSGVEGAQYEGVHVPAETQANYVIRYYLLGLASGMMDRAYWYVLESPTVGLLVGPGVKGSSYDAFAFLARTLSGARFERRWTTPEGVYVLEFTKAGGRFLVGWTADGGSYSLAVRRGELRDKGGKILGTVADEVTLGPSPVYVFLEQADRVGR